MAGSGYLHRRTRWRLPMRILERGRNPANTRPVDSVGNLPLIPPPSSPTLLFSSLLVHFSFSPFCVSSFPLLLLLLLLLLLPLHLTSCVAYAYLAIPVSCLSPTFPPQGKVQVQVYERTIVKT